MTCPCYDPLVFGHQSYCGQGGIRWYDIRPIFPSEAREETGGLRRLLPRPPQPRNAQGRFIRVRYGDEPHIRRRRRG